MMNRRIFYLVALAFLTLVLPACNRARTKTDYIGQTIGRETNTHNWIAQYGIWDNGKVEYVAFSGSKKPEKPTSIIMTRSSEKDTVLEFDGTTVNVTGYQLFEYVDGKFRKNKGDVTPDEITGFIQSEPDSYTIDTLLSFVETRRSDRPQNQ